MLRIHLAFKFLAVAVIALSALVLPRNVGAVTYDIGITTAFCEPR